MESAREYAEAGNENATSNESVADFDNTTKTLHILLVVTIVFQMIIGLFVHESNRMYLYAHEYVGVAATVVLIVKWLWIFAKSQFYLFFPWDKAGLTKVYTDTKLLLSLKLPKGGTTIGLAGFWHGIGLLIFSVLSITGVMMLFNLPGGNSILGITSNNYLEFTHLSLFHILASYAGWVYLAGHVATAILHQMQGDNILARTFIIGRK